MINHYKDLNVNGMRRENKKGRGDAERRKKRRKQGERGGNDGPDGETVKKNTRPISHFLSAFITFITLWLISKSASCWWGHSLFICWLFQMPLLALFDIEIAKRV